MLRTVADLITDSSALDYPVNSNVADSIAMRYYFKHQFALIIVNASRCGGIRCVR